MTAFPRAPEFSKHVHRARYFYLRRPTKKKFDLVLLCGGRETCNPDYMVNRETFPYFALEWVEKGTGSVSLNGQTWPLQPGSIFCYGPGTLCQIKTDPQRLLTKVFINFTGEKAVELLAQAGLQAGTVARYSHVTELSEIMDNLASSVTYTNTANSEVGACYLRLFLEKIRFGQTKSRVELRGADFETYLRCQRFIQEHASELPSLKEACKDLRLSPAYVCRLFSRFGRVSPYQFLLRTKMNLALEPLSKKGLLMKEVARALGYPDPNHFSRVFKQIHGVSPKAMQQLLQRNDQRP